MRKDSTELQVYRSLRRRSLLDQIRPHGLVSVSIATILKPAGLEKSKGLIAAGYIVDVTDLRYKDDPDVKAWKDFTDKHMSTSEFVDVNAASGFNDVAPLVQALKQCGNDLSRDNIMRQAANLKDVHAPLLFPGISVNTSPTNYSPIRQLQLITFNGTN